MKFKKFKIVTILMAAILCLAFMTACSSGKASKGDSVGEFSMQDLNDNTYTESMFEDHTITMVNVFATWCTPCVEEIPYLEELSKSMEDQGVQVVGIVLDTLNEEGEIDEEAMEKARLLAEKTGATYPMLIPDSGYMNGMLEGIDSVPYTFFVDQDGKVIGDAVGSNDLEGWTSTIEKLLK